MHRLHLSRLSCCWLLQVCEPGFKDARVVDSAVLRFPKAVTHFSPGSYASR
jgi:hypothetical protein